MQTVDIKGKEYVMVNERLKYFREHFKDHALISEIIELSEKWCVIKATVYNANGNPIATGLAYENQGSTFINKNSYIENCETSAWGRALGNLGIGIDVNVASAEEVANAIANQGSNGGKPATNGKMTAIQKKAIVETGKRRNLTEREIDSLIVWAAGKKKIPADSQLVPAIFLGKNDDGEWKFDVVLNAYNEAAKK